MTVLGFARRVVSVAILAPSPGAEPESFHLGDDLGAAAGERPAHVAADADDLGDAVAVHLVEHEPEPGGELAAQRRLEDRLGGVALAVEGSSVEGGAPPVGAFGDVEDGPVQVDTGIAEPAGPVKEHRTHEAVARFDDGAGVASANEAGVGLEVALDLRPGGVQGLLDLAGVVVGAERPHQRDRLGRREREVEAGDRGVVGGQLEAVGVDACEGLGEGFSVGGAGEPVSLGEAADPSAGRGSRPRRGSPRGRSMTSRS